MSYEVPAPLNLAQQLDLLPACYTAVDDASKRLVDANELVVHATGEQQAAQQALINSQASLATALDRVFHLAAATTPDGVPVQNIGENYLEYLKLVPKPQGQKILHAATEGIKKFRTLSDNPESLVLCDYEEGEPAVFLGHLASAAELQFTRAERIAFIEGNVSLVSRGKKPSYGKPERVSVPLDMFKTAAIGIDEVRASIADTAELLESREPSSFSIDDAVAFSRGLLTAKAILKKQPAIEVDLSSEESQLLSALGSFVLRQISTEISPNHPARLTIGMQKTAENIFEFYRWSMLKSAPDQHRQLGQQLRDQFAKLISMGTERYEIIPYPVSNALLNGFIHKETGRTVAVKHEISPHLNPTAFKILASLARDGKNLRAKS